MRGGSFIAPTIGILLLACGPAAARATRPGPGTAEPTPAQGTSHAPEGGRLPPAPRAAFECRVDVEIREPERAHGSGTSEVSATEAHTLAWQRACDDLRARSGLDCEDETQVRVVKRSSSTRAVAAGDTAKPHYEQVFELVGYRVAHGEGGSDESFAQACAAASHHACEAALGTACPEGRVVVLRAEGDDRDRSPAAPPSRRTI